MSKSSRKKEPRAEEAPAAIEPEKAPTAEPARPTSPSPNAMVKARHRSTVHERQGRGFSRSEVERAGLNAHKARAWGLIVDSRRRSELEANVKALRKWSRQPEKPSAVQKEKRRKKQEKKE